MKWDETQYLKDRYRIIDNGTTVERYESISGSTNICYGGEVFEIPSQKYVSIKWELVLSYMNRSDGGGIYLGVANNTKWKNTWSYDCKYNTSIVVFFFICGG